MKFIRFLWIATSATALMLILSLPLITMPHVETAQAQTTPQLFIGEAANQPPTYTVIIDQVITAPIYLQNVVTATGVSFQLTFDPTIVELVDEAGNSASKIEISDIFDINAVQLNTVNNSTGIINLNARSLSALTTTEPIAVLRWRGDALGVSPQSFVTAQLLDTAGNALGMPTTTDGGNIEVVEEPAEIKILPSPLALSAGQMLSQDVVVSGVDNLREVQLRLMFDPSKVQVKDNDAGQEGVQIAVGDLFQGAFSVSENNVDNVNGIIDFRVIGNNAINTDGSVAQITWQAVDNGTSEVNFRLRTLFDANNRPIDVTSTDGFVIVSGVSDPATMTPTPTPTGTASPTPTPTDALPILGVSPTSLTFEAIVGEPDPAAQTVTITNNDTEPLSWVATASSSGDWLSVDPTSGTVTVDTPSVVNARINQVNLGPGTYTGQINVSLSGGFQTVPVTLIVRDSAAETATPTPTPTPTPSTTPAPTMTPTTTPGTTAISGQILLEGRADNGAEVVFYRSALNCAAFTPTAADEVGATIDAEGNFQLDTSDTFTCLKISRPGHLMGQRTTPSGYLGTLELPGGDFVPAGGDNAIDIFDLSYVGAKYQHADSLADFNESGAVDILDLSIVAANYKQAGPVSDWR